MSAIRITAVSYLNTKPLLYGLLKSDLADELELQLDIPSICAQKLLSGQADIGLVPVAVLPELNAPRIISDYCIGANGTVRTVCIFSDCPLEQVQRLYLDFHSRTSVELTKILLAEYWHLSPELIPAYEGYESQIEGTTAGLVIGDRAVGLEQKHPYVYDLGNAWKDLTGLPFVFAAWVSTQPLEPRFLERFNRALEAGIHDIPQLKYLLPSPHPDFSVEDYFLHNISYELDQPKRRALSLFLEKMRAHVQPSLRQSLQQVSH